MFSSVKLRSKILLTVNLNNYAYFIYILEPFYNRLLNTDKILHEIKADIVTATFKVAKPKALGLILENTINTNEENKQQKHSSMKRYVNAMLIYEVKATSVRSDGHNSITGLIHMTCRSDQPHTN